MRNGGELMRRISVPMMILVLLVSGCAGKMDAKRGLSEEWRLRSLEENFLNFKEGQREQEEKAADRDRKTQERLKALEDAVQRMQEGGVAMKRPAPAQQAPLASAAPAPAYAAPAPAHAPMPQPAPQPAPQPMPKPAPQAAPQTMAAEPMESERTWTEATGPRDAAAYESAPTGTSLYNQGMGLIRTERPENAAQGRAMLTTFLSSDPNSTLVPNALYWIGESWFVEKSYPQAILALKDVTRRFPKHHKAAAALLKIGMAYERMGEKDNAALYLRALLQDYPKSEPAPAARKLLKDLGA